MTSKTPLFNLVKEDLRSRTLSIILSIIVEFLFFPIAALSFFSMHRDFNISMVLLYVREMVGFGNLVATVGAIICAYSSFGYLFDKRKVDFYHSIPVNKNRAFMVRYFNGLLVYIIPVIAFMLISFPIFSAHSVLNAKLVYVIIRLVIINLLAFLLVYNVFILGNVLAGNSVNSWFINILIGAYAVAVGNLISIYMNTFLDTYKIGDLAIEKITKLFSPFALIVEMSASSTLSLIPAIISILVLFALDYIFFMHRKLENAGYGAIYKGLSGVLRFLTCFAIGLGVGLVFTNIHFRAVGWLIFGIVFGAAVTHILINSMFSMGIKGAISKGKWHLLAVVIFSIFIGMVFRYDLIGYDRYIPTQNNIDAMGVSFGGLGIEIPPRGRILKAQGKLDVKKVMTLSEYSFEEFDYRNIEIKDIDRAYDVAVAAKKIQERNNTMYSNDNGVKDRPYYIDKYWPNRSLFLDVSYSLKNGGKKIRHYNVQNDPELVEKVVKLYNSDNFKNITAQSILGKDTENLVAVYLPKKSVSFSYIDPDYGTNEILSNVLCLDKVQANLFYKCYMEDYKDSSCNESRNYSPGTEARVVYQDDENTYVYIVRLYENYTRTLDFIRQAGYQGFENNIRNYDNMNSMDINIDYKAQYDNQIYYGKDFPNATADTEYYGTTKTITNHEYMKLIAQSLEKDYKEKYKYLESGKYTITIAYGNNADFRTYEVPNNSNTEKLIAEKIK